MQTAETESTDVVPGLVSYGEHCFAQVRYPRPFSNYYPGRIELLFSDLLCELYACDRERRVPELLGAEERQVKDYWADSAQVVSGAIVNAVS